MNLRLYLQTLRWNQVRLAAVVVAAIGWGILLPVIYVQFAKVFKDLANSGAIPKELLNFGSGSLFTLPGALTLGLQHPLAIAFVGIFAVGSTVSAIAGEREAGTLEVLLSRPISRRFPTTVFLRKTISLCKSHWVSRYSPSEDGRG